MRGRMVFIFGAGASKPYGYPTAQELVEQIAYDQVADQSPLKGLDKYEQLKKNLATSKARSVDIFLGRDSQERFQEVGKWAIAEKLIQCEQHGNVFGKTKGYKDKIRIDDDWYAYLFNTLTFGIRDLDAVASLPISFITFNYDRSLEYFLFNYLNSNFPDNEPIDVNNVINRLPIIHVYGRMDHLPSEEPDGRAYTNTVTPDTVKAAAAKIRLLHKADDEETVKALDWSQRLMDMAKYIWILGFSYHPENMDRLKVPFHKATGRLDQLHIFGTVYGMTQAEADGSGTSTQMGTGIPVRTSTTRLQTHFAIMAAFWKPSVCGNAIALASILLARTRFLVGP